MQGRHLFFPVHIPGTLSADLSVYFKAPFDLQLIRVQAVGSNASDATIRLGVPADDDAYLSTQNVGDSGAPAEYGRADFAGAQFPHLSAGSLLLLTVDYDGASGVAVQNLTAVLVFSEG